jgi:hypothetical protein
MRIVFGLARPDERIHAFFYSGAKMQDVGKEAGCLLPRPLIIQTKPDRCEFAKEVDHEGLP